MKTIFPILLGQHISCACGGWHHSGHLDMPRKISDQVRPGDFLKPCLVGELRAAWATWAKVKTHFTSWDSLELENGDVAIFRKASRPDRAGCTGLWLRSFNAKLKTAGFTTTMRRAKRDGSGEEDVQVADPEWIDQLLIVLMLLTPAQRAVVDDAAQEGLPVIWEAA